MRRASHRTIEHAPHEKQVRVRIVVVAWVEQHVRDAEVGHGGAQKFGQWLRPCPALVGHVGRCADAPRSVAASARGDAFTWRAGCARPHARPAVGEGRAVNFPARRHHLGDETHRCAVKQRVAILVEHRFAAASGAEAVADLGAPQVAVSASKVFGPDLVAGLVERIGALEARRALTSLQVAGPFASHEEIGQREIQIAL
mmetsp:Transcript_34751/g.111016  ORF Transcript_34751/g.111016 Transcript_34751/m.111016 type:complete len:200 (-) Transcript_34751:185-784(-)